MATRPRKIFLDANIVIRAGKPPGGPLIPRVTDLVGVGYVKVVTTDLTRMEIAKKHAGYDFEVMGALSKRRVRDLAHAILGARWLPLALLVRASLQQNRQKLLHNNVLSGWSMGF